MPSLILDHQFLSVTNYGMIAMPFDMADKFLSDFSLRQNDGSLIACQFVDRWKFLIDDVPESFCLAVLGLSPDLLKRRLQLRYRTFSASTPDSQYVSFILVKRL